MKKKNLPEERPKATIREKVADAVDFSKEILLDSVLISCIGNRELTVENYKGILEYSDTCIKIKANPNTVKITGSNIEIKNISQELLYITGKIKSFGFSDN